MKICDRCGEIASSVLSIDKEHLHLDICDKCTQAVIEFVKPDSVLKKVRSKLTLKKNSA